MGSKYNYFKSLESIYISAIQKIQIFVTIRNMLYLIFEKVSIANNKFLTP